MWLLADYLRRGQYNVCRLLISWAHVDPSSNNVSPASEHQASYWGRRKQKGDGRGFKRCPVPGLCRRQPEQCWECWSWGPQREYKLLTFLYAPDLSQHKIDISTPVPVLLATCWKQCTHWLKDPRLKARGSSQFKLKCYPWRLVDMKWIIMNSIIVYWFNHSQQWRALVA